jgi:hypothetical protein
MAIRGAVSVRMPVPEIVGADGLVHLVQRVPRRHQLCYTACRIVASCTEVSDNLNNITCLSCVTQELHRIERRYFHAMSSCG